MPDPTSVSTATLVMAGAAVPTLTAFGVPLGLRPDVLLAGFLGAMAAIALLNTVPSTGDTWRELVRTTLRRAFVTITSAFVAGYLAPAMINDTAALSTLLSAAFAVGAGAQGILKIAVERFGSKGDLKP